MGASVIERNNFNPGTTIAVVAEMSRFRFKALVPEKYLKDIALQDTISLLFNAYDNLRTRAVVTKNFIQRKCRERNYEIYAWGRISRLGKYACYTQSQICSGQYGDKQKKTLYPLMKKNMSYTRLYGFIPSKSCLAMARTRLMCLWFARREIEAHAAGSLVTRLALCTRADNGDSGWENYCDSVTTTQHTTTNRHWAGGEHIFEEIEHFFSVVTKALGRTRKADCQGFWRSERSALRLLKNVLPTMRKNTTIKSNETMKWFIMR